MREHEFCFAHSPDHREEAGEARRLGGIRRRREHVVRGSYDVDGLESVAGIRRLLEIAVVDTLALENSIARSRTLGYLATAASRLFRDVDVEDRVTALEQAVRSTRETT